MTIGYNDVDDNVVLVALKRDIFTMLLAEIYVTLLLML